MVIDTDKVVLGDATNAGISVQARVGGFNGSHVGTTLGNGFVCAYDSTNVMFTVRENTGSTFNFVGSSLQNLSIAAIAMGATYELPISGWEA